MESAVLYSKGQYSSCIFCNLVMKYSRQQIEVLTENRFPQRNISSFSHAFHLGLNQQQL